MSENVRRTNTKTCSLCGKMKYTNGKNFYRNSTCDACYQKSYRQKNPEKYRSTKLKHLYGITQKDFVVKLAEQDNCCAVCKVTENRLGNGKVQNFVVDHCHATGKVRGLLCHDCNKNVGVVENWQTQIAAYLSKY